MNDVRPLAYLLTRTIVNGVKRAVTSPKRLIALLAFGFYYYQMILGRFIGAPQRSIPVPTGQRFPLPDPAVIDACVFGAVGVLSILLMTSVLSYRGGFKAADVDVLFPTPVSPRVVLLFRIVRDTLATLLLPLLIAAFSYKGAAPALAPLFRDYPKQGGDIFRAFFLSYLLVSAVWVCVGYAASLFVNRSDLQSDRNRRRINWGIAAVILGLVAYISFRLRMDLSAATLLSIAQSPVVRIVLAPVTLATWATMGAFQGNTAFALGGFLGLIAIIALALRVSLTQVGWMYDQAAVRGFDSGQNLRSLQRKGDILGIQAERARQGKLKHGRIARRISNLRVHGPVALLWKEAILQARGSLSSVIAIGVIYLAATGMLLWAVAHGSKSGSGAGAGWLLMGAQGMLVYTTCIASSQGGSIEFLRRVDVQKPLPFTPAATVFWEVVAKAIAPSVLAFLCAIVGVVLAPAAWPHALAGTLLAPAVALMLTAVVLLVILLFPDMEDPTQRMFRGLMMLLGIVIVLIPGAGVFGLGIINHISPIFIALPVLAIDFGITIGLSALAGALYSNYNPTE